MSRQLPFRQIHLDFHTGPAIHDVGSLFDATEFARTMKEAHVESVNVFSKCHHGHLYHRTSRPERHPGLKPGLDLTGSQVEALRKEGIAAPIYISVQCDEYAANTHPEWIARQPDGRPVGAGPLQPGWQVMDMSSPYQDYLAEQLQEVLDLYTPVDGIWFDMCWDQPSSNRYAQKGMVSAGLDPKSDEERAIYARQVAQGYMARYAAMVRAQSPEALMYFNCRPYHLLPEEIQWFEQVEIEALPTGGWGYQYFPAHVRFIRGMGKPYLGVTARFHKCWADFGGLKPDAALEYETAQMVAHGAQCSVGDQLHPRGILDPAAYAAIGRVYKRIADREPWLVGATPLTEIAVLYAGADAAARLSKADEGVTRLLTQLKHQFDFVHPRGDWDRYPVVVVGDETVVDRPLADRLEAYVGAGGRLLVTGRGAFGDDATACLLPALGVDPDGMSPYTTTYIRTGPGLHAAIPAADHVFYERGARARAGAGAISLASIVEPYFERDWDHFCSHFQTPPDAETDYSALVVTNSTACIPLPIFSAFAQHGSPVLRHMVAAALARLLPQPLLQVEAPTSTEATVTRQGDRTIVHLLQYCAERRAEGMDLVEDVVPLYHVPLSIRAGIGAGRAYTAPDRAELPVTLVGGRLDVVVPEVRGHAMVVFEA